MNGGYKEHELEFLFHPQSVAVVGASANPTTKAYDYLKGLQELGFRGAIYPINPKVDELLGLKAYHSLKEVPGTVDYVISCIPASASLQLVAECAAKKTKAIQLFTAGFSETGEPKGKGLEAELVQMSRQYGIRIIGPNCMGVHYPRGGLAMGRAPFSKKGGNVGCVVQSGGHGWNLLCSGSLRGIGFSKIISFGNACDLNEADFLEYLTDDPETEIIAAYLEGVKNGARFANVIKRASGVKPVIMYKGGRTKAGMRAVSSHTGAVAGANLIWESMFHQAGVVPVSSLEELVDVLLPFVYFPPICGGKIGIVGVGGGASVEAADACENLGLSVPPLPAELREKLKEFIPLTGSSLGNPVDMEIGNVANFIRTLELIAAGGVVDVLFVHILIEMIAQRQEQSVLDSLVDSLLAAGGAINKPLTIALYSYGTPRGLSSFYDIRKRFIQARIFVYPAISRAANAISKFISYHQRRRLSLGA